MAWVRTEWSVLERRMLGTLVVAAGVLTLGILAVLGVEWFGTVRDILGWIVAGSVTLWGVRLAHRLQERTRERQEDRVRVFEPLLREITGIVKRQHLTDEDVGGLWSAMHTSEDFQRVLDSGMLMDFRHDGLRWDIDGLRRLEQKYRERSTELRHKVAVAIETVMLKASARRTDLEEPVGGDVLAKQLRYDGELLVALSVGDLHRWTSRLAGMRLDRWDPSPEELYKDVETAIEVVRRGYRASARALYEHCVQIYRGLSNAIRHGSPYAGTPRTWPAPWHKG